MVPQGAPTLSASMKIPNIYDTVLEGEHVPSQFILRSDFPQCQHRFRESLG